MTISALFPFFSSRCDAPPAPPPLPPVGGSGDTSASPPLLPPPSASAGGSTPPPPAVAPLPESTTADLPPAPDVSTGGGDDAIARAAATASACVNPGPLEAATWEARRITSVDTYDGFRVEISKQLSPFFSAVHSFHLGTTMLPDGRNSSYGFAVQLNDESGFAMARADPARGSIDGRIHRALLGGMAMGKVQVGLSAPGAEGDGQNDQLLAEVDLGAETWTANVKAGTMFGGNVLGLNYLQAVSPRLTMGGEGMYVGANGNRMGSYTAKLALNPKSGTDADDSDGGIADAAAAAGGPPLNAAPSYVAATYNAGQGALSLNYVRTVTPGRVNVAAALECSPSTLESQVTVGAEFQLARSKVNMCVDGTGRIQSALEAKLGRDPGSPALSFAAELDHGKNVLRFGYGLNIGS